MSSFSKFLVDAEAGVELARALISAERLLRDEYDAMVQSACPMSKELAPIREQIDIEFAALALRYEETFRVIAVAKAMLPPGLLVELEGRVE